MAWGAPNNVQQYQQQQTNRNFQSNYQTLLAGNGPQFAQGDLQRNAGLRNLGYAGQQYGLQAGDQRLSYEGQLNDLAAQMGGNAIDLAAAQRQDPYYEKLQGLSFWDNILKGQGNELARDRNQSDQLSAVTGAGAGTSRGNREAIGFINKDFDLSEGLRKTGYEKEQLGLAEQRAQAGDRVKQLQLQAQNLGTKPDLLRRQLENSLGQLGLSNSMTVDDILDGLAKNDLDTLQLYNNLIQYAGTYTSIGGK